MPIQFVNNQRKYSLEAAKKLIEAVFVEIRNIEPVCLRMSRNQIDLALSVSFVSKAAIRNVNAETRGIDKVTDVLSFPMLAMKDGKLEQRLKDADLDLSTEQPTVFLGDLLICLEKADQQASEYGHRFEREIAFLAAHGILHLLGYDHDTPEREQKMLLRQRNVLDTLGLSRDLK